MHYPVCLYITCVTIVSSALSCVFVHYMCYHCIKRHCPVCFRWSPSSVSLCGLSTSVTSTTLLTVDHGWRSVPQTTCTVRESLNHSLVCAQSGQCPYFFLTRRTPWDGTTLFPSRHVSCWQTGSTASFQDVPYTGVQHLRKESLLQKLLTVKGIQLLLIFSWGF